MNTPNTAPFDFSEISIDPIRHLADGYQAMRDDDYAAALDKFEHGINLAAEDPKAEAEAPPHVKRHYDLQAINALRLSGAVYIAKQYAGGEQRSETVIPDTVSRISGSHKVISIAIDSKRQGRDLLGRMAEDAFGEHELIMARVKTFAAVTQKNTASRFANALEEADELLESAARHAQADTTQSLAHYYRGRNARLMGNEVVAMDGLYYGQKFAQKAREAGRLTVAATSSEKHMRQAAQSKRKALRSLKTRP